MGESVVGRFVLDARPISTKFRVVHEHDRLYLVTLNPDGAVGTISIRYGSPKPEWG